MSFILDALKKSEIDRQRQATPGFAESGILRPKRRLPMWAIVLGISLLAVNLIVLLLLLTRGWMSGSPRDATQAHHIAPEAAGSPASTGSNAPTAAEGQFSPLDAPPVYAPEILASPGVAATSQAPFVRQPVNPGSSGTHAIHHRDPVLNEPDYKAEDEEVLPSINQINLSGAQSLPELHLDVHVFATKSAERFVFINMRKYHEGATLEEGPTIERIRRDGVVLDYEGLRFLLPRQ